MAKNWEFMLFYDGECPVCRREIDWLSRKKNASGIVFRDISDPAFDAEGETGKSFSELMRRLHGQLPTGEWVIGADAVRMLYHTLGYRRLSAWSRWPVIRGLVDGLYTVFAYLRLKLTGKGHYWDCRDCVCDVGNVGAQVSSSPVHGTARMKDGIRP